MKRLPAVVTSIPLDRDVVQTIVVVFPEDSHLLIVRSHSIDNLNLFPPWTNMHSAGFPRNVCLEHRPHPRLCFLYDTSGRRSEVVLKD